MLEPAPPTVSPLLLIVISEEDIDEGKSVTDDLALVSLACNAVPLPVPPQGSLEP